MTASSATARFLSLAVLLLSLAPLASLYIVFFSLFGVGPSSFVLLEQGVGDRNSGGEWQDAAQAVVNHAAAHHQSIDWSQLASNRTALEELLRSIYTETSKHQPNHPLWSALRELAPTNVPLMGVGIGGPTAVLSQHWSIVVPWILTFILGVVVPMILSLWSFWRQYRRGRRGSDNSKRRYKEIMKRLQGFSKHLVPQDQVSDSASSLTDSLGAEPTKEASVCERTLLSASTTVTDDESSVAVARPEKEPLHDKACAWWLPMPGQRFVNNPEQTRRMVPGSCVICLNAYELTEKVAWSSNPLCVHCFHTECISQWLSRQVECPCCRRVFLTHKIKKD